jgi:hypothetical protein
MKPRRPDAPPKSNPRFPLAALGLLAATALGAAGCGGLQLKLANASVQKPSNVALYFSVETNAGDPVGGLKADSFKIYEDDQLISPFESKQTILNPEESVIHYTLLLLDLSGSITESGQLSSLIAAASAFADRVTKYHQVGVVGFDGGEKLIPIVGFTTTGGAVASGLSRLEGRKAKDPSTNLNGAVVEGLKFLDAQMAKATQSLRFGTVVVFTDGTDRAHRLTDDALFEALDQAPDVSLFAIGIGAEISEDHLRRIGRSGFVKAGADQAAVQGAFDEVAARIERAARKYYLLSYCSPSRAGTHGIRVEAMVGKDMGSLEHEFAADGFAPNCDPNKKPSFPIGRAVKHHAGDEPEGAKPGAKKE